MKMNRLGMLLLAVIAVGAGSTARALDVGLTAADWEEIAGFHTTIPLANDANGFLYFNFQTETDTSCRQSGKCHSMDYLFTRATHLPTTNIAGFLRLKVTVATTGNPVFHWETEAERLCPNPSAPTARVRPLINTYGDGSNRWWSEIYYELGPGTSTLTVPLVPSNWRDVNGHLASENSSYTQQFLSDLTHITALGMTFGGGCSSGHGVYITPTTATAKFTVEDYELLPDCPVAHGCPPLFCFDQDGNISSCAPGNGACTDANLGYPVCYSGSSLTTLCTSGQNIHTSTCPCTCQGSNCGTSLSVDCQ